MRFSVIRSMLAAAAAVTVGVTLQAPAQTHTRGAETQHSTPVSLHDWQPTAVRRIDVPGGVSLAVTVDDLPVHGKLPPGETRQDVGAAFVSAFARARLPPVYGMTNLRGYGPESPSLSVLRDWRASGNLLGNHTDEHTDLDTESAAKFEADIVADEPMLREYAGTTDWHWFRYPFLHEGDTAAKRDGVRAYLHDHGYQVAEVSLDFEDYLWNDPYARCMARHDEAAVADLERTYLATANEYIDVTRDMNQKLYGRQIPTVLLLHIGAFDARMLPRLIELLRSRGFRFTTLAAAQDDEAYRRDLHVGDGGGGILQEIQAMATPIDFEKNTKPWKQLDAVCR